jgi:hypothetical protein
MQDYVAPQHDSNLMATAVNCALYRTTAQEVDQKEMDVFKQRGRQKELQQMEKIGSTKNRRGFR